MGRLKYRLMQFMYGRYGIDKLYFFLLAVYLLLAVLNLFLRSPLVSVLGTGVIVFMFFRVFSRNIYRRRAENEKFLRMWNRIKKHIKLTTRRIREIRTHRYRRCPSCSVMLRLPRRSGRHMVKCPRCGNRFRLNIRW